MATTDRSLDLLVLLRGEGESTAGGTGSSGLYVVKVLTASPEVTISFEGSDLPLGPDIFEIPIRFQPLEEGSRYFALPIINSGQRWGLVEKLDGEEVTGTFTTVDNKTVTVTNGLVKKIE